MQPIQLFDSASSTYTYVLFDEVSREALINSSAIWHACANTA